MATEGGPMNKTTYLLTPPLAANDGRIKVLWIDDHFDELIPPATTLIRPWFAVQCVCGPADIKSLIDASGAEAVPGPGDAYDRTGLPFDVYLLDFRLCDRKHVDGWCESPAHQRLGAHAPAAGLLLGLLTALRFSTHPQALLPYSAHEEEFGDTWNLCKTFCPQNIQVLADRSSSKSEAGFSVLLRRVPDLFRKALEHALRDEVIQMPFAERNRWEKRLAGGGTLQATEHLEFVGQYGRRHFLLGGLFYDCCSDNETVPATAVREWLDVVPATGPVIAQALELAGWFWMLRQDPLSQWVYSIIEITRRGGSVSDLPPAPPSLPWLGEWKVAGEHINEVRRLVVLFLLLEEEAHRVELRRRIEGGEDDDAEAFFDYLRLLRREPGTSAAAYDGTPLANALAQRQPEEVSAFMQMLDRVLTACPREAGGPFDSFHLPLFVHLSRRGPLREGDVVRLLDPLPPSWDVTLSLDKSQKVGAGLARLSLDVKSLLAGDGSALSANESSLCRRYARGLMPDSLEWPAWLRHAPAR
jgi:hypothetical protein